MQLNRDLEGVIEGLHTGYYQEITVDAENNRVHLSDPWHGKILYALGYRTNADELSHYLLDKVRESTVKLQSQTLSKEERLEILTTVKLLKVLVSDERVEHSPAIDDSLLEIKKISTIFKSNLANDPVSLKADEILDEINRFGQDKMSVHHQVEQRLQFNERTKEVLKAYKSIETETKKMRLHSSESEIFTIHGQGNENILFRAYSISPTQQFIVHATDLSNAVSLVNVFKDKEFPLSTMCVSLIDSQTGFSGDQYRDRAALILGVNSKQIVLTTPWDIYSPIPSVKNDRSEEKGSKAYKYYHTQQRILRLSERIEQIHKASGYVTCDFNRLNELKNDLYELTKEEVALSEPVHQILKTIINYKKEISFIQKNMTSGKVEQRQAKLESLKKVVDFLMSQLDEKIIVLDKKRLEIDEVQAQLKKNQYLFDLMNLPESFRDLAGYYYDNPEKNLSSEEFQKIFGYPGQNILQELEKYIGFWKTINVGNRMQRLESPEDLLAATGKKISKYNEINIKLDTLQAPTPSVEGILLTRKTIQAYTTDAKDAKEFSQLTLYAQKNNIPIFILEGRVKQPTAKL